MSIDSSVLVPALAHMKSNPSITLSPATTGARLSPPGAQSPASSPSTSPRMATRRVSPSPLPLVLPGRRSRPSSIPSSPTSIHSSSSAIFERDIESIPGFSLNPITPTKPGMPKPDPHRTSRGSAHEPLESSVPSVLSSAAFALSSNGVAEDAGTISVIVPASTATASPPSSFAILSSGSRSPSPTGTHFSFSQSPTQSSRLPLPERENSGPLPAGSFPSSYSSSSPPPLSPPSLPSPRPKRSTQSLATTIAPDDRSPSPPTNRLSFISYHDLLLSTPVAATPLSTFTSPPSSDPPPHLPMIVSASGTTSPVSGLLTGTGVGHVGWGKEDGGEWEREGLGKGLEERLEEVLRAEADARA
ncbi:hypothetical protein BOTBODRAFT_48388 [Botryobasidium botryosum FD-172 SS1]|uniref:Uncharacterized protein n=1 Tax=Botryobasidium botryosum (strain FD-172 SS1) TaxID=930990 RepID=A0A067M927_BOTB1|nr:hypothetical protein BOTBODRAFT_48388 [Botryobasidium botryosum FD-172 SS1]